MNYINLIRAEIERRIKRNKEEYAPDGLFEVQDNFAKLLAFLDTLPEQPESTIMTNEMLMGEIQPEQPMVKKSNALFDKCVANCDPAVMKEVSDNIDKMLASERLEEVDWRVRLSRPGIIGKEDRS